MILYEYLKHFKHLRTLISTKPTSHITLSNVVALFDSVFFSSIWCCTVGPFCLSPTYWRSSSESLRPPTRGFSSSTSSRVSFIQIFRHKLVSFRVKSACEHVFISSDKDYFAEQYTVFYSLQEARQCPDLLDTRL